MRFHHPGSGIGDKICQPSEVVEAALFPLLRWSEGKMINVLIGSEADAARQVIVRTLGPQCDFLPAPSPEACFSAVKGKIFDIIFVDIRFLCLGRPGTDPGGLAVSLEILNRHNPAAEVIVLASSKSLQAGMHAVSQGAIHYLTYPVHPQDLRYIKEKLEKSFRVKTELEYFRDRFWKIDSLEMIHTASPLMQEVFAKVRAVAPTKSTVLLTGETGTGKGVVARLIHQHSNRSAGHFLSVHCGAIPEPLLESELFGYEKGAFTGAARRKLGKFEIAAGGTLFLDEIGCSPIQAQIKLLQVLQERKFERVGGEEEIEADVRVIAATNEDLQKRCKEGGFRQDLFYRLNIFPIEIPPLRARRQDIPILTSIFLKRLNRYNAKNIQEVNPLVMEALESYSWPGNIRELENLIERAYILETSPALTPASFPGELFGHPLALKSSIPDTSRSLAEVRRKTIEDLEQQYLAKLLEEHRGHLAQVALAAGIGVRQLHKLMTKYHFHKKDFRHGRSHS
jgi:DNA-binding NtrC family response regulator